MSNNFDREQYPAALRSDIPEWIELEDHACDIQGSTISSLFDCDSKRFDEFNISLENFVFDYSKQLVSRETITKLCAYARACDIEEWRDKMFSGATINNTEERAVLHTALRTPSKQKIMLDGKDISLGIHNVLGKMKKLSNKIRKEKRFKNIVNIGIGGSDLGCVMAYEALKKFSDRDLNIHFVSNVDSTHLAEVLYQLEPQETLFIIASKTFTTLETMTNANSAREWLTEKLGTNKVSDHFIGITRNVDLAVDFGVKKENILQVWNWVGGRFSIWSAMGLSLSIAIGFDNFEEMLDGAHIMDKHFIETPLEKNMPAILGMIGIWNRNFLNHETLAIVPYDQYLHRLPAFLQQLDMESNGKSVDRQGRKIPYHTGPIVFGEAGTNAQHAFFQLIHQGTSIVPCEFIATVKNHNPIGDHQQKLIANALAQSKALMDGKYDDDPNNAFEGNRPSSTLLIEELTPKTLGMLISLYEHKIFVQGILWNINSFDQCGVELGKTLAKDIITSLKDDNSSTRTDSSTKNLIEITEKMS